VKPADIRFYFDADILGLAKLIAGLRADVTYPGDSGAVIHGRTRPDRPSHNGSSPNWPARLKANSNDVLCSVGLRRHGMNEEQDGQEVDGERDRELGVMAAAHAALDQKRRAQRADILVESVLQVVRKQPLPEERIVQDVQRLWNTQSITAPLVRSALADARAANLVVPQDTLTGMDWAVTGEGQRDTQEDAQWAQFVLARFEEEVRSRLDDDSNKLLVNERNISKIAIRLREAIAIGAEGLYALNIAASPGALRPLRFNERAAFDHLDTLEPKTAQRAAARLLISAINPRDSFGDELVHLLVTGNVLYGMVTRRDVESKPDLTGVRIAVDTSELVDLPARDTPRAVAIQEAFRLSKALGVEVIVAEHTIREWMRLFEASDEEMKKVGATAGLGLWGDLLDNPFTRAFSRLCEQEPSLSWPKFRATWGDPTRQLQQLGVNVRPNGNLSDADRDTVQQMKRALVTENRERGARKPYVLRLRKMVALEADAESAAMVARWRQKRGPQAAYFIAQDRMTSRAYAETFPEDRTPLAITLTGWVTMAAALTTEDPDKQAVCAEIVKNVALSESFLAIAAGYTYEEVSELAATLAADSMEATPADVSEFVQQAFEDIEQENAILHKPNAMRLRGSRILASRSARRNQRARRAQGMVQATVDQARQEERVAAAVSVSDVVRAATDSRAALQRQLDREAEERAKERTLAEERLRRQRRLTFTVSVVLVVAGASVVAGVSGHLTGVDRWAALIVSGGLIGIFCIAYVTNPKVKWWQLAGVGLTGILINVITDLLTKVF